MHKAQAAQAKRSGAKIVSREQYRKRRGRVGSAKASSGVGAAGQQLVQGAWCITGQEKKAGEQGCLGLGLGS